MDETQTIAERVLLEARVDMPDMASCAAGPEGQPSRLALALIAGAEMERGQVESKLTDLEIAELSAAAPGAVWYRAVYRFEDGSFLAILDAGAEVATSERYVIRNAAGAFEGVLDDRHPESFARSISRSFARRGPVSMEDLEDVAIDINGLSIHGPGVPLSDLRGVITVMEDGSALVATEVGVALLPGNSKDMQLQLDHAYACMNRMTARLGIPREEMLAELNPTAKVFVEAMQLWERTSKMTPAEIVASMPHLPD